MRDPEERLLEVARNLSDTGARGVDWDDAIARARDEEEQELIALLRDIGSIAGQQTPSKKPDDLMSETAPRTWGPLEIGEKLGEGAAAEVFRARDTKLDHEVALKLFHRVASHDAERRERLLTEGKHLARVHHPNVVRVYTADEHDGRVGLWMELVEGKTLSEIVEDQGPYSAAEAAQIGKELCRAVASVHRERLVHGDIKAQNVKRGEGGRFVLMDFSSSRSSGHMESEGDTTGTPLYMAPELWKGESSSPATDIYALGVLLYYLVTGEFPVRARTVDELRRAHEAGHRHLLRDERPDLPEPFVRTVEKALDADPVNRFRSAGEMAGLLRERLSVPDKPNDQPEPRIPDELTVIARVSRVLMWAGLCASVLAFLGFITSTALNVALSRPSAFAPQTVLDWMVWGLRSLIGPAFHLVSRGLFLAATALILWLAWRSSWVRKRLSSPIDRMARGAERAGLGEPKTLSYLAAALGAVALAVLVWLYSPLISAVYALQVTPVDPQTIAMLSPSNEPYHLDYRAHFTLLVTALGLSAVAISGYAKLKEESPALGLLGGVFLVSLVLLQFPWQILFQADFPKLVVAGEVCYEAGARGDESFLFCPLSEQKTRVVNLEEVDYETTGVVESAFTLPEELNPSRDP